MTATIPAPARTAATIPALTLGVGTIVRVENKAGTFRISSPAGWGGPGHATPTSYNLIGPDGRIISAVPADQVSVTSNALRVALLEAGSHKSSPIIQRDPLLRFLNDPEATMRMARRFLGRQADENRSLRDFAEMLLPRFIQTHCWRCRGDLDNLSHEACPKCEGIKCKCGGCRCNWPYPPQSGLRGRHWSECTQELHLPG